LSIADERREFSDANVLTYCSKKDFSKIMLCLHGQGGEQFYTPPPHMMVFLRF